MAAGTSRRDEHVAATGVVRIGAVSAHSIEDVLALARGALRAELDDDPSYRERLAASRAALERAHEGGGEIYGVTTGVGASIDVSIPWEHRAELALNLVRFHGCGTGRILDETEAGAVVAVRLISLARGQSGVRAALVERLCELLNQRVLPRIPEEGSVGASGDLTPLCVPQTSDGLPRLIALRDTVRKSVPRLTRDRRQDLDIERVLAMLRADALPLAQV